jgi:hypothetical protein
LGDARRRQPALGGERGDAADPRLQLAHAGRAGLDPGEQGGVLGGALLEAKAAAVRHRHGRLLKEQALLRRLRVDPASLLVLERDLVQVRLVAEEGELEAAFPGG